VPILVSIVLVIATVSGLAGAGIAQSKGNNTLLWGIICFLFPLAIIGALLARGRRREPHAWEILTSEAGCLSGPRIEGRSAERRSGGLRSATSDSPARAGTMQLRRN